MKPLLSGLVLRTKLKILRSRSGTIVHFSSSLVYFRTNQRVKVSFSAVNLRFIALHAVNKYEDYTHGAPHRLVHSLTTHFAHCGLTHSRMAVSPGNGTVVSVVPSSPTGAYRHSLALRRCVALEKSTFAIKSNLNSAYFHRAVGRHSAIPDLPDLPFVRGIGKVLKLNDTTFEQRGSLK